MLRPLAGNQHESVEDLHACVDQQIEHQKTEQQDQKAFDRSPVWVMAVSLTA